MRGQYLTKTMIGVSLIWSMLGGGVLHAAYTDYLGAGHSSGVTVTASSTDDNGTNDLVDGSGLSGNTHSTNYLHAWQSPTTAANPISSYGSTHWAKIDFGENYNLADMWYWNYNESCCENRGMNQVAIDYSTDNINWTNLGTYTFDQASGTSSYAGKQGPNFSGATARYVLITGLSNHGGTFSTGLSEVKFNIAQSGGGSSSWKKINDQENVFLKYDGPWYRQTSIFNGDPNPNYCSICYQQNYTETESSQASVEYLFTGTKVRLLGRRASGGGTAQVFIDGVLANNSIGFSSSSVQGNVMLYESNTLSNESHVIRVVNKNNSPIFIDGFEVYSEDGPPAPSGTFRAYHTKILGHLTDTSTGPYADILVDMPNGGQLQFARQRAYLPVWIAPSSTSHNIDDAIPGKHNDGDLRMTYARIIENTASKIVVHVRYYENIDYPTLQTVENPDPVSKDGFSSVVNEIFTIYPNHTIDREILNGTNTKYESWSVPGFASTQAITLTPSGVSHGPIISGVNPNSYPGIAGNPIKSMPSGVPTPAVSWNFDDGLSAHKDLVTENQSGNSSTASGLMELYKKGVSGTALAFDGYTNEVRYSQSNSPAFGTAFTAEAWVAPNAYPWEVAPIIHRSYDIGDTGFLLGMTAHGKVIFHLDNNTVTSATALPLWEWSHVVAAYDGSQIQIYINGVPSGSAKSFSGDITEINEDIIIGRNNEIDLNADPVRPTLTANLEFFFGYEGLMDEVRLYNTGLNSSQITALYNQFKPANLNSDLAKPLLPGQNGVSTFGATYSNLPYSEIWDGMWRAYKADVTVKFDDNPGSVVFWRGTNGAPSWVADNNRWLADQSTELNTMTYGLAEHMSDKQNRYASTSIISSNPARVVVRWRDTSADLGYYKEFNGHVFDEVFTIYPDAVGLRNVTYYASLNAGFQDIQLLTNPGETATDVVSLTALTMANKNGTELPLTWSKSGNNATIPTIPEGFHSVVQKVNVNSPQSLYVMAQEFEAESGPWGGFEQSPYTADPFAGPWNHWPISFTPSDGRFASAHDRVTHFALAGTETLYTLMYAIGSGSAASKVDLAKSWDDPASVSSTTGARYLQYKTAARAFRFYKTGSQVSFTLNASAANPVVNPAFEIKNWGSATANASIGITGASSNDIRQGVEIEPDGSYTLVVWAKVSTTSPVTFTIN